MSVTICLHDRTGWIWYLFKIHLWLSVYVGHAAHHDSTTSGPNLLFKSDRFFAFFYITFFYPFSQHYLFLHSLLPAISLNLSFSPSVLYGKTFLMFYSALLKPGAYFQCPKLIANVRKDPSPGSPRPPPPPPLLAWTVRIRGTFSWPYWTLGF